MAYSVLFITRHSQTYHMVVIDQVFTFDELTKNAIDKFYNQFIILLFALYIIIVLPRIVAGLIEIAGLI